MSSRSRCEKARRLVREKFDQIPLAEAQFLWDHANRDYPTVEQSFVALPHMLESINPHAFSSSTGSDTEGWPNANYNNPGFVFGNMIFREWASEAEKVEAIAEFAKIEGVEWAREILRGYAYQVGAFERAEAPNYWADIKSIADVERFRDGILEALDREHKDEDE
jgi:hypothetical protein